MKGEEWDNDERETKLEFAQTVCNGVIIKDGLAHLSGAETTVRLDYATNRIKVADVASEGVLDAIDSALGVAEIILNHSLTVKQSKLAWAFVEWLATFIEPVSSYWF